MQRDLQREDAYLLLAFCVSMHDKLPQRKCIAIKNTIEYPHSHRLRDL